MSTETFEQTRARLRGYYGRDELVLQQRQRSLKHSSDNTRDFLQWALRTAYENHEGHVWVRDFHDGWVVYEREWMVGDTFNDETLRRPYTIDAEGNVTLGDDVEEVRPVRQVTYQPVRAFLTEANGRTLLTAPATALAERAATHQYMLRMRGRFVGAEKANRNGALWTTADLEMGQPTVTHGPLNWLHEERHVIGSIARSELVRPTTEQAGVLGDPYITAESAVWKWLYPQEAAVIEQASEQAKLWYSMECVSENVHCGECAGVYPYLDTIRASESVCMHVKAKTATRRFENPTFLGGAVIVPPVRPGWGDANAEVAREAASYAEKAYEQAGRPDVAASEWEQLMAEVLRFANR